MRVLWNIFAPNVGKMLRDVELYDSYSSIYIILVIKSRGMAWAGHVTRSVEE